MTMDNKLEIFQESDNENILLRLSGRLDAGNAIYLDDKLTELIQEGHYNVKLNTAEITFLSSAGIRILVKQSKSFKNVSGNLSIIKYSEPVKVVLDMVGMSNLFDFKEGAKPKTKSSDYSIEKHGYSFNRKNINLNNQSELIFEGNTSKFENCNFTKEDSVNLKLKKPFYGIGIGAFGNNYEDCKNQYGEFIALGKILACLPSGNIKTPDYMISSGNLVPEINTLYYIGKNDSFQFEYSFDPVSEKAISAGNIIETIFTETGIKNLAFLMIAESAGLVGASLNYSPTKECEIFGFPQIRENIRFTTEPAHLKSMTVSFGIVSKQEESSISEYLRATGDKEFYSHIHSAVFTYFPLQKEIPDYESTIKHLFEQSEIIDIIHLIKDDRDINGIGESQFKSGHIWLSEIEI